MAWPVPPSLVAQLEPITLLQCAFLVAASMILAAGSIPAFSSRFLVYGSRAAEAFTVPATPSRNTCAALLLDRLATYRVPHSWFTHFYVLSVLASLFWAGQYASDGTSLKNIVGRATGHGRATMSATQVRTAWLLMLVQGSRRLYESAALSRPSASKMWIGHWLLGLSFYGAMSIAVWVEGSPTLQGADRDGIMPSLLQVPQAGGVLLFLWASKRQHDAHVYLFGLPKYTLPSRGAFNHAFCPHYATECVIYMALSMVAAPEGALVNRTVFCALVFVSVNLGVTAARTRGWYAAKFGRGVTERRARMVPFLW